MKLQPRHCEERNDVATSMKVEHTSANCRRRNRIATLRSQLRIKVGAREDSRSLTAIPKPDYPMAGYSAQCQTCNCKHGYRTATTHNND